MTRRFLYHLFWNLYDYLGTYLLLGSVSGLLLLLIFSVTALIGSKVSPGGPQFAVLGGGLIIIMLLLAYALGGFFEFAATAARDEPARLPVFRSGAKRLFPAYLKLLMISAVISALFMANIVFYLRFATSSQAAGPRIIFSSLGMAFVWLAVCALAWFHSTISMPARATDDDRRVLPLMKRGFVMFILIPFFWFAVTIIHLLLFTVLVISVVGYLFILPVFATLAATASELAGRRLDFLKQARSELGESHTIGEYRRRAVQLEQEWEARQPKRGFRELIKPWENS